MPLIDCFGKIGVPQGMRDYITAKKELFMKQGLDENTASHKAVDDLKNGTVQSLYDLHSKIKTGADKEAWDNKFVKPSSEIKPKDSLLPNTGNQNDPAQEHNAENKSTKPAVIMPPDAANQFGQTTRDISGVPPVDNVGENAQI